MNANGEAFETETHLNNLSASGLQLRLSQPVKQGAELFIIIWLAPSPNSETGTPRVAVRGIVSRVEPESAGAYGIAVSAVGHYRFL